MEIDIDPSKEEYEQMSKVQPVIPITPPQAVASTVQPTVAPAAGGPLATGPKTVRQRIIENDPLLRDLA